MTSLMDEGVRFRHPLLEDFLQQNPECDEESADRAFLVYQDLTEVRGWWFTELCYSDTLERPFVTGRASRRLPKQVVLPISLEERLSLHDIQTFFCRIMPSGEPIKSLTLAVNELDSTVVYYKTTSGLSPPDPPEVTTQRNRDRNNAYERKKSRIAACVQQALAAAARADTLPIESEMLEEEL